MDLRSIPKMVRESYFLARKPKKGVMGDLINIGLGIGVFIIVLAVVGLMMARLDSVNQNSLGNNTNVTATVSDGFALIDLTQSLAQLAILAVIFAAVIGYILIFGGIRGRGSR